MSDHTDRPRPDVRPAGSLAARYAQLRTDPAARRVLQARSRVVDVLRRALHDSGHVEVDTPLLQRSRPASGRSFRTETRSLDPHIYLPSSPLHLRAMLTTGLERVFEIGRSFRDEPVDPTHSPEYSLVELYQAGADYTTLRTTARDLITAAAGAVLGGTEIRTRTGDTVDLAPEWQVVPFHTALSTTLDRRSTPAPRQPSCAHSPSGTRCRCVPARRPRRSCWSSMTASSRPPPPRRPSTSTSLPGHRRSRRPAGTTSGWRRSGTW
jgi:lysyl-tRNA synthetase class II